MPETPTMDAQGNDIENVGVPTGGLWAWAPLETTNVIPDADMGKTPLTLPSGYSKLGLIKEDGGPQEGHETEDPIEFFQEDYGLAGDAKRNVTINLAEDNEAVNSLVDGKEPNEQGVVYVDEALPIDPFILFGLTRFKNGRELRRNGVAKITAIEVDQEERGSVRGKAVTFTWQPHLLFQGAPYKRWLGKPTVTAGGQSAPMQITGGELPLEEV